MPQTLTFTKVFTAEGEKNGKAWKRWDFKTEDGQRYVTFNAGLANAISVNTPVTVDIEGDNKIAAIVGSAPAGQQQTPATPSEAVRTAPVASQGASEKDTMIHRQTATKVAASLLPLYPAEEQTTETFIALAKRLVHFYAFGE